MNTIAGQNASNDDVTPNIPTTISPHDIDKSLIIHRRHALGLSRDAFAQLVNMRPGAVWRIENKTFKPGEREHLAAIANRWLLGDAPTSPQTHPRPPRLTSPTTTTKQMSTPADDASNIVDVTDDASSKCKNVLTALTEQRIEIVFSYDQVSPSTLSLLDGYRRVSNSEVQTFKRCRRKWWLSYIRGLRLKMTQPFGACASGTRIHLALAGWYRPNGEDRLDPRDVLEVVIQHERERLTADSSVDPESLAQFNKDVELERVVVAGYMEWLKETGIDADYTVIGSERYLEALLPEIDNTCIIARLDARVTRTYDNAHMFIDHKTVASISQAVRMLTLNEQMMWYILLEELQPDRDPDQRVGGALYNMLRRCKRTATAKPPFYERIEVHYNPIEITSFRKRLVGTLTEMWKCRDALTTNESLHHQITYPTPSRDCTWDCPFLKVCSMFNDGSRVEDALEAHYTIGDPYAYYVSTPIEQDEYVSVKR